MQRTQVFVAILLNPLLYLAYGSKEKTNTGWKFLNNYFNKKEKQGDKAKNQLNNNISLGNVFFN